jgi:hypothetical protein
MEIESVKNRISAIHEVWNALGDSLDNFKYGQIHESFVVEIISEYCIGKGYQVDGFPIQKRELAMVNKTYNEDYFCYDRYVKYLDVLATKVEEVFELMFFYSSTFWPGHFDDKESYKQTLLDYISCDVYEIDF